MPSQSEISGVEIYQKKQLRSFIWFACKKLMSPIPQLQNLELPILHPKSQKKDSLPVSAAPTTSFRWRSAGNRHRAWPWSKLRSGEPLPKIKWTQHRWFLAHPADLFFLWHIANQCESRFQKSMSLHLASSFGLWQTQLQNLKIAFRSWYQKKLC